jgi:hypothetical protein
MPCERNFARNSLAYLQTVGRCTEVPLQLLFCTSSEKEPTDMQLPSWVPDWTRLEQVIYLSYANCEMVDPGPLFQATRGTSPLLEVDKYEQILSLTGVRLDIVQTISTTWSDWGQLEQKVQLTELPSDWTHTWSLSQWYQECRLIAEVSHSGLEDEFYLTMLCDLHFTVTGGVIRSRAPKEHGKLLKSATSCCSEGVNWALKGDLARGHLLLE